MAAASHEPFDLVNFWLALTWSFTWKLFVIILVFKNFKNFPFSWHVSISRSIILASSFPSSSLALMINLDSSITRIPLSSTLE